MRRHLPSPPVVGVKLVKQRTSEFYLVLMEKSLLRDITLSYHMSSLQAHQLIQVWGAVHMPSSHIQRHTIVVFETFNEVVVVGP